MLQFPQNTDPSKFQDKLQQIEILRQTLLSIPLTPAQTRHIFHRQLFKSALFSARIEGNILTLETAKNLDLTKPKQKKARELSNITKAHQLLTEIKKLDLKETKSLHKVVMNGLTTSAGQLRGETTAIFDQLGNVVYITPAPTEAKQMLAVFFTKINLPVTALADQLNLIINCHYYFEKIHPFVDGNGRTGRVLLHWQLKKFQLFGDYVLPLEEYFDLHRSQYYFYLEKNTTRMAGFYQFFLESLIWALEKQLEEIKNLSLEKPPVNLLPRRQEIVNIITDHPHCSLDFIARRFPTIPPRTIQYDLAQLVKDKLINKHGQTRGVVYTVSQTTAYISG